MSFTNIMFFSGSILHEEDLLQSDTFTAQVRDKITNDLAPNHPVEDYENQDARDEALGLAVENAMANSDAMAYARALNQILSEYCYRDYLKCIHERLGGTFEAQPWCYLMYQGKNVLAHGTTPYHFYAPGIIRIRSSDGPKEIAEKLKKDTSIGKFARTASIAEAGKFDYMGIKKEAKFLKRRVRGQDEYHVINAADPIPEGWNAFAVDGKATVGNSSSRVIKADMDAFVGKMREADLGFPVFSVSDCNSFHTSGYLWATYAIRSVMKDGDDAPVAILNFDQHKDIGATGASSILASDGWGGPALATVRNGLYMSFGNAFAGKTEGLNKDYNWPNVLIVRKNGVSQELTIGSARTKTNGKHYTGTDQIPGMTDEEKLWYVGGVIAKLKARWNSVLGKPKEASLASLAHGGNNVQGMPQALGFPSRIDQLDLGAIFTEFWKCLSAYIGHTIKYVFITVDRDAVQRHQTQWGDQSFFPNAYSLYYALSTITDSLLALYDDCKLIGVDITGLPESRVAYRHRDNILVSTDDAWEEVSDEITLLRKWGNAHVARRWSDTVSNAFVHKAEIIFSNLHRDVGGKTLKRYLSVDTIAAVNRLWAKVEKLQAHPGSLLKHTMFEAEIRDAMARIATGLRDGARKMFVSDRISKEAKTTLHAYAQRIDHLLDPPMQQPRLQRSSSLF